MPFNQADLKQIGNEGYLPIKVAAPHLNMSDRQLRREVARKNIQYLRWNNELYFHPDWCEDYIRSKIVKPRKIMR